MFLKMAPKNCLFPPTPNNTKYSTFLNLVFRLKIVFRGNLTPYSEPASNFLSFGMQFSSISSILRILKHNQRSGENITIFRNMWCNVFQVSHGPNNNNSKRKSNFDQFWRYATRIMVFGLHTAKIYQNLIFFLNYCYLDHMRPKKHCTTCF